MLRIPALLDHDALKRVRALLDAGDWIDGNITSGSQSALAKHNSQLSETSPQAVEAGRIVLDALAASPLFVAVALPLKVYPPLFNRYAQGDAFGGHVDTAVRIRPGSDFRVRCDLSATLFLSGPDDYDGGILTVGDAQAKHVAGDLALYPAGEVHHVTPVTRGVRMASFFWVQSMVRDAGARAILFDLDGATQATAAKLGQDDPAVIRLTGLYHNLLRRWTEL